MQSRSKKNTADVWILDNNESDWSGLIWHLEALGVTVEWLGRLPYFTVDPAPVLLVGDGACPELGSQIEVLIGNNPHVQIGRLGCDTNALDADPINPGIDNTDTANHTFLIDRRLSVALRCALIKEYLALSRRSLRSAPARENYRSAPIASRPSIPTATTATPAHPSFLQDCRQFVRLCLSIR